MSQSPVHVTEIQRMYHTALWCPPAEEPDRALFANQLRGHMRQLLPELAALLPRMQGAERHIAQRLITATTQILQTSDDNLHDLGTHCRAMLTLLQKPGPLLNAAQQGLATREPPSPWPHPWCHPGRLRGASPRTCAYGAVIT
jgi:hypothetical protein